MFYSRQPTTQTKFTIQCMAETMQLSKRLNEQRWKVAASELDVALETRARMHCVAASPYTPIYGTDHLFAGTYYLSSLEGQRRRTYARVPLIATPSQAPGLNPSRARDLALPGRFHAAGSRIACVITGTAAGLPGSPQVFSSDKQFDKTRQWIPVHWTGVGPGHHCDVGKECGAHEKDGAK
jgi:Hydroxymethylglutaryl-coenzyme A synthase C terminal